MSEYKAKNVSTEKALEYIAESRAYWEKVKELEVIKAEERNKGIQQGLNIAEEIFTCSNYESGEGTYSEGVKDTIYELGKELDVPSADILKAGGSVDQICAAMANRINNRDVKEAIWMHSKQDAGYCECSACGYATQAQNAVKVSGMNNNYVDLIWHHCPNCGAEMSFDNEY